MYFEVGKNYVQIGHTGHIEASLRIETKLKNGNFKGKLLRSYDRKEITTTVRPEESSLWTLLKENMFYKNPCKVKTNPRKRTKAKAIKSASRAPVKAYKKAEKSGLGFSKKVAAAVDVYFKKLAKKLPKENPRKSFPKTSRGRKPVTRSWVIEMFGAGNKKLGAHIVKRTKAAAEKVAKSGVGKKFRGKTIHRVVLDGPH